MAYINIINLIIIRSFSSFDSGSSCLVFMHVPGSPLHEHIHVYTSQAFLQEQRPLLYNQLTQAHFMMPITSGAGAFFTIIET